LQRGQIGYDTANNRLWVTCWGTSLYDSLDAKYQYTEYFSDPWSDSGVGGWLDSTGAPNNTSSRTGITEWINGEPAALVLSDTSIVVCQWDNVNDSFYVASQDTIKVENSIKSQQRAFSFNAILDATADSSTLIFCHGEADTLWAYWRKHAGGNGAWSSQHLDTADYPTMSGEDFQNAGMVINGKFCLFYIDRTGADSYDSQFVYMRAYDPDDNSWSARELVTRGYPGKTGVYYFNPVHNAYSRQGFAIWEHSTTDSIFYITITDTSSADAGESNTKNMGNTVLGKVKL